jgi:uncharacterized protein
VVTSLLLAVAGAIVFDLLRFPAGTLVGALVGSLVASSLGFEAVRLAGWELPAIAAVIGIVMAARLSRGLVRELRRSIVPALFTAAVMVVFGFVLGLAAAPVTGWGLATAAFSVYPGGLEQMIVFAGSVDGDVVIVTTVQLIRWLTVVLAYPLVLGAIGAARAVTQVPRDGARLPNAVAPGPPSSWSRTDLFVIVAGGVAGYAVHATGLPAGAMLGAFLAATLVQGALGRRPVPVPGIAVKLTLAALGVVLGSGVDATLLVSDIAVLLWAAVITTVLILASLAGAGLLHLSTRRPLLACVVAMAPAGMIEMTVLAEELGLDPMPVFVIHFARTFGIVVCAPLLFAAVA